MTKYNLEQIRFFLLDMDGTVYLGNTLLEGAQEFIKEVKAQGKDFSFLTNNSSKSAEAYLRKLDKLGLPVERKNVVTSTDVLIYYLQNEKPGAVLYPVATKYMEQELIKAGFELVYEFDETVALDYVVVGFDTSLEYNKLFDACRYIRSGVSYLATHPDFNCPLENDVYMPDCGAIIEFIKASTGAEPAKVMGKPNSLVVDMLTDKKGLKREDMAMMGDRLYTDIVLGANSGIPSILVLSGETTREDLKNSNINPDFVFSGIKEVLKELQMLRS